MEPFWAVVLVSLGVGAILVLLHIFGFDLEKLWLFVPITLIVFTILSFVPLVGDFFHMLFRGTWIFGCAAIGWWLIFTCLTGGFDPWRRN